MSFSAGFSLMKVFALLSRDPTLSRVQCRAEAELLGSARCFVAELLFSSTLSSVSICVLLVLIFSAFIQHEAYCCYYCCNHDGCNHPCYSSSWITLFRWGGGPSYTPLATASADGAAEGQISFAVWRCHRAIDVVEVLLSLLHPGVALAVHIGWRTGGPGELRLRVDPLWATGECVSFPLNVDFMDWSIHF